MGAFMTQRHYGGTAHIRLKEELVSKAKEKARELGANAILETKLAISRGKHQKHEHVRVRFMY